MGRLTFPGKVFFCAILIFQRQRDAKKVHQPTPLIFKCNNPDADMYKMLAEIGVEV